MHKEWTVARYGTLEAFGLHLGRSALAMGLDRAKKLVFLSDGLRANWQICFDHFPGALQILDFYHASEHLAGFCILYKNPDKAQRRYVGCYEMLLDGEALQVIAEIFASGPIAMILTSFDIWGANLPRIEIYGTAGSLSVPYPNTFGDPVQILCRGETEWQEVPLVYGYIENSRGLGIADMALPVSSSGLRLPLHDGGFRKPT